MRSNKNIDGNGATTRFRATPVTDASFALGVLSKDVGATSQQKDNHRMSWSLAPGPWSLPSGRFCCRRARRGGQILVITLLGMSLLVGLLFYVYNTGDVMNRRLDLQSTSDSVAITGAVWMARSMNTVAMDNVGMSRNLAAVVVLDSLPLATEMALSEVDAFEKGTSAQLNRPNGFPNDAGGNYLKQGLQTLQLRLATQRDILTPVDNSLSRGTFDMEQTAHWSIRGTSFPPPHGKLWQAIVAMDNLSQATAQTAGTVAQCDATEYAKVNAVSTAFITPILPVMPARRGTFNDFRPVLTGNEFVDSENATMRPTGGSGGAIPDMEYPHRLGPWARLYYDGNYSNPAGRGWRNLIWDHRGGGGGTQGTWVSTISVRPPPGVPTMAGASAVTRSSGHWVGGTPGAPQTGEIIGYTTYGPYNWMMRTIDNWASDHYHGNTFRPGQLSDTFFYRYINRISRVKLNYMFPPSVGKAPVVYHYPLWITDYPQAKALATAPNVRVISTMYYVVEIASSVPEGQAGYLAAGTFRTNGDKPINSRFRRWFDVATRRGLNAVQVSDYVWKCNYTYQVTADPELGINLQLDAQGNPVWQDAYLTRWYVFGGIDVGGDVQISNPCDWDSIANLPAPMLLDTTDGDYDPVTQDADAGFRRDRFTYLGTAYRDTTAKLYPKWFSTGTSSPMFAMAQAKVFNSSSFDLWTQDWQAQLTPVTQWDDWRQKIAAGASDAYVVRDWVDPRTISTVQEFMAKFSAPTADLYVDH